MINKVKWLVLSLYRSPNNENLINLFDELNKFLNYGSSKYDNIIIMGNLYIDLSDYKASGHQTLIELCDTFGLSNIIKNKTCFTSNHESLIDIILTIGESPLNIQILMNWVLAIITNSLQQH